MARALPTVNARTLVRIAASVQRDGQGVSSSHGTPCNLEVYSNISLEWWNSRKVDSGKAD